MTHSMLKCSLLGILVPCAAPAQTLLLDGHAGISRANISSYSGGVNYAANAQDAGGVSAGLGLQLKLNRLLALRLEADYAQKGTQGLRSGYFELPMLARLAAPWSPGGVTVAGVAGVAPSWLLHCTYQEPGGGIQPQAGAPGTTTAPTTADPCRSIFTDLNDFGWVGGLALSRSAGRGILEAELRYTRGTSDIASAYQCCVVQNRAIQVLIGYALRLH